MDKSRLLDKVGAIGDDRLLLAKVLDPVDELAGHTLLLQILGDLDVKIIF